jgi:hypothetical protein
MFTSAWMLDGSSGFGSWYTAGAAHRNIPKHDLERVFPDMEIMVSCPNMEICYQIYLARVLVMYNGLGTIEKLLYDLPESSPYLPLCEW